jgi:hypothetical protein
MRINREAAAVKLRDTDVWTPLPPAENQRNSLAGGRRCANKKRNVDEAEELGRALLLQPYYTSESENCQDFFSKKRINFSEPDKMYSRIV